MRVLTETQRFNQWWMKLIYAGLIAFLLFSLYNWYIAKEPTGNVVETDLIGQLVVIGTILPLLLLFYF